MERQPILKPGIKKREVLSWAFYDFANSGYTTVVLTSVFSAYFVGNLAPDPRSGTLWLTLTLSASYVLLMVTLPRLGLWADQQGAKKKLLFISTALCVVCTALLFFSAPGWLWWAILFLFLSNYAYGVGEAMIAAYLPYLAQSNALGRVSGWGWGFGYFGGMLSLGAALVIVIKAEKFGWAAAQYVPWIMILTAAIFAVASIPALIFLREPVPRRVKKTESFQKQSLRTLLTACKQQYPSFYYLLWCGAFYHAGISVVVTLSSVYATQVMGFSISQTMLLIFLVNIAAAIGAMGFGHVQDHIGHKRALAITLVGWLVMVLLAALTTSVVWFWGAAALAGLCIGSSQSAGRAMVGLLTPSSRSAEMYSLWAFSIQCAAVVGPVAYGVINWLSQNNQRLALGCTALFFIAALWVLRTIRFQA